MSGVLATPIVLTQLQYIILAIVLAYVLTPAQQRLEHHMSADLAAITLTLLSVLLLVIFVANIITVAVQQGLALLSAIQAGEFSHDVIQDRIAAIGYMVDLDLLVATYQEPIAAGLDRLATGAVTAIGGLPGVFIGLTVTTFVLFVLFLDGDRFVSWLRAVVPLSEPIQQELLTDLDHLMWASVVGNVAVEGIQALLIGVGLLFVGIPSVIFLAVVMFILSLLPLVGTFWVWIPVLIYLLVIERPMSALIIFAIGFIVTASGIYLRPKYVT